MGLEEDEREEPENTCYGNSWSPVGLVEEDPLRGRIINWVCLVSLIIDISLWIFLMILIK